MRKSNRGNMNVLLYRNNQAEVQMDIIVPQVKYLISITAHIIPKGKFLNHI